MKITAFTAEDCFLPKSLFSAFAVALAHQAADVKRLAVTESTDEQNARLKELRADDPISCSSLSMSFPTCLSSMRDSIG